MTTQPELPFDSFVGVGEPVPVAPEVPAETPEVPDEVPDVVADVAPVTEEAPATPAPAPVTPAPPTPDLDQERRNLERQRREHEDLLERDKVIRELEQEAIQMEQRLMDQGLASSEAKQQTMGHLQNRVNEIESQRHIQAQGRIQQGKRNASIHYAKKYNLGLDALQNLERAETPDEMESRAKGMFETAKLQRENAELRARLAPQQEFDTNTPTPAASTNEERLLDQYLAGDRSDAATAAAAKLLGIR